MPRRSRGHRHQGRLFFGDFLLAKQKKVTALPGEHPGKSSLRFTLYEPREQLKVSLYTIERGFLMNEDMANFLLDNPDIDVNVGLVG